MRRSARTLFLLLVCAASFSPILHAQKTILIRLLDAKTGHRITPTSFEVRINHQAAVHIDWVKQDEDGTATLTLPADAAVLLVHATYQSSMDTYVNCDDQKQYESPSPRWYSASEILSTGIVADNGCIKPKDESKLKVAPQPGQFVLYVRPLNWREQWKD